MELLFASLNQNKVAEISAMLGDHITVKSMRELGLTRQIEETGTTLDENSYLKARALFNAAKKPCFADDSGLEVFALNMSPGVYSSRYAGANAGDAENTAFLLKNLENEHNREARFRTVITLIINDGEIHRFEGTVNGRIIKEARGTNGFGYDPIFIPRAYEKTFAEMSAEEKNAISHRAKAFMQMRHFLGGPHI